MNLKQKKCLFVLIIFACSICVNGQKKKVVTDKYDEPPPVKVSNKIVKKTGVDYLTTVEIDENSKVKVVLESSSNSVDFTESFFSTLNQKTVSKKINSTEIIVKPNPVLKFGEVVNLIQKIRNSPTQNITVEVSEGVFANVPKLSTKAEMLAPPRPNPLMLVVTLDKNRRILLNYEEQGTINDLSQLTDLLRLIFKERADQGIFREGTNEIETSIFIKAPLSVIFSDVVRIVEALKLSGSSQIGLQIDDLQP